MTKKRNNKNCERQMSKHDDNDNTNEGQRLELQGKPKGMRSHSCDAIQCLFLEHAYHKTKPPRTNHDTITHCQDN